MYAYCCFFKLLLSIFWRRFYWCYCLVTKRPCVLIITQSVPNFNILESTLVLEIWTKREEITNLGLTDIYKNTLGANYFVSILPN